ncbi:DUF6069 family protein, partial [Streptomyces alkaliphilus]|uniref:DUF6069 family protein n=1 Tax=Streptomyces alkaliphilus TaxID=1472722 RepID=UPI0015F9733E
RPTPARRRALTAAAAIVITALIRVIAGSVFGVDIRVPDGPGSTTTSELPLLNVVISVAVLSLAGWGLLALLERLAPARARVLWIGIASAVVLVSLLGPLFGEGLSAGNRLTLICLHLAVGAVLIPGYTRGAIRS